MCKGLKLTFQNCTRLNRKPDKAPRQVLSVLKAIGGTILEISGGNPHSNPEGDIEKGGSIIIQPGVAHPALEREPYPNFKRRPPSASFSYIHDLRKFKLSQGQWGTKTLDAMAKGQLAISRLLYPHLRPTYGWIDESGQNEPSEKSIAKTELRHLFWANYFGPAYVKKYGRSFLLKAPGHLTVELDDGGILYVVTRSYLEWDTRRSPRAVRYFQAKVPTVVPYRSSGFEEMEQSLAEPPPRARDGKVSRRRKKIQERS